MEQSLHHTGLLVLHDHQQAAPFHVTILFWDCECEADYIYIHPVTEDECFVCRAQRENQPPARVNEIMRQSHRLPRGLIQVIDEMLAGLGAEPIPF